MPTRAFRPSFGADTPSAERGIVKFAVQRPLPFSTETDAPAGLPFARYLALAALILAGSWGFTKLGLLLLPHASAPLVKAAVDGTLFLVSYAAQRAWVFRPRRP